jgi:hypothetical protein
MWADIHLDLILKTTDAIDFEGGFQVSIPSESYIVFDIKNEAVTEANL